MATARNVGTAGCVFFINFAHIWLQVYRFLGGPIALHGLVHFLNTNGPALTKVVYAYFDPSSNTYLCVYIYTYTYIYISVCVQKKKNIV